MGLKWVDMEVAERRSLRHFSRKYRETEGAPGSGLGNLGLAFACRLKTLSTERDSSIETGVPQQISGMKWRDTRTASPIFPLVRSRKRFGRGGGDRTKNDDEET